MFDVRGTGLLRAVEFDFELDRAPEVDLKGKPFAMTVQAKCMEKGLVIMGMTGQYFSLFLLGRLGSRC